MGANAADALSTSAGAALSTLERAPCRARDFDLTLAVLGAREVDKDLLEWRLTDRVVVDVVLFLGAFHRAEHTRPRQLLAGYLSPINLFIYSLIIFFIYLLVTKIAQTVQKYRLNISLQINGYVFH